MNWWMIVAIGIYVLASVWVPVAITNGGTHFWGYPGEHWFMRFILPVLFTILWPVTILWALWERWRMSRPVTKTPKKPEKEDLVEKTRDAGFSEAAVQSVQATIDAGERLQKTVAKTKKKPSKPWHNKRRKDWGPH
jgi:type VI protein secretion system component VasK